MGNSEVTRTLLLSCDATQRDGLGHFMRCFSLAQAAQAAGWKVHFTGTIETSLALQVLSKHNYRLQQPVSESSEILALGATLSANVVHVDRYQGFGDLGSGENEVLTSTATDGKFGQRYAAVIIDGSPGAVERFNPHYSAADVALGPEYLAVRSDLRDFSWSELHDSTAQTVLVVMGGTDADGYGPAVAAAVAALPGVAKVGLVGDDHKLSNIVHVRRAPDLPTVIKPWNIVVTASGTTAWELASMGVPMGLVGTAENQREQYEWLTENGIAVGLGFLPTPNGDGIRVELLAELLERSEVRREASTRGKMAVDGNGAKRIVATWAAALEDRALVEFGLRAATMRDSGRLFGWRNDIASRQSSRNSAPLVWADHVRWLRSSINRTDRLLFVGVAKGKPVGIVRFDQLDAAEWEISIAVAPSARGKGYGTRLISLGVEALCTTIATARVIRAVLRPQNAASAALFSRHRFERVLADPEWETWILKI